MIDETNLTTEDIEVNVWAVADVETFGVDLTEVSPGQSHLEELLFIKHVPKRCRGDPFVLVDLRPWYS
ncbi:hypothetical protein [Halorubrum gandharaense]